MWRRNLRRLLEAASRHALHTASEGKWLPNKIYNFTQRVQTLAPAYPPRVGVVSIYNFNSFTETLHCFLPYRSITRELAVEKTSTDGARGEKTGFLQAKVKRTVWAGQGFQWFYSSAVAF